MGLDVSAKIVVGLRGSELDITLAPLYDEFMAVEEWEEARDFSGLLEYYYYRVDLPSWKRELRAIRTHENNVDPDEVVIGFVVADSGDWDIKELNLSEIGADTAALRFADIFHQSPKVYLMPRYW